MAPVPANTSVGRGPTRAGIERWRAESDVFRDVRAEATAVHQHGERTVEICCARNDGGEHGAVEPVAQQASVWQRAAVLTRYYEER